MGVGRGVPSSKPLPAPEGAAASSPGPGVEDGGARSAINRFSLKWT